MQRHRGTKHPTVESPGNREHGIPDGFAFESLQIHPMHEQILRIALFGVSIIGLARHPVGTREDQPAK